jgi:hypothetical protein
MNRPNQRPALHRLDEPIPGKTGQAVGAILTDPAIHLVIILNPPGIWKARLAIETATNLLPNFTDGVYFLVSFLALEHQYFRIQKGWAKLWQKTR